MKKLNPKNEKNTTRLPMPPKVKRGFRLYAVTVIALTMVMSMAMPAFAATNDPLTVVNNLSEFIFGLIRAVGMKAGMAMLITMVSAITVTAYRRKPRLTLGDMDIGVVFFSFLGFSFFMICSSC